MGCGLTCVKYLLFIFNFIFWVAGGGVLAIGLWMRIDRATFDPLLGIDYYPIVCWTLIGVGGFVFLVGFLGCCGAVQESKCMLGFYFFLLIVVFVGEVGAGILAYYYHDEVRTWMDSHMERTIKNNYGFVPAVTAAVTTMQEQMKCCGGDRSYVDWMSSKYFTEGKAPANTSVPLSCCRDQTEAGCNRGQPGQPADISKIFTQGCIRSMELWVQEQVWILGGVGVGVGLLQLFGMVFACCLMKAVEDEYE
ncbi:CD151 antigen-like isoform X2 [Branchiostoma floridae]|uniref:Tetraspanin n=1 Tax=Branchiostoma floridae TaxID=7739 RepID=A0A9J7L1N6_BRAFL|nr:CD151 antigen-like isoform X2 [Branchiostoma floridae]